ncbi:MAG TPA: LysR family transcriptional regulator [Nocardioidaceae bacterium]|nr:LysR family transcriptional regulator [Nocardioidaceae bacterium]
MPLPPTVPELAALDLFLSVVECGSVSGAAAAHGISQPAASVRIRRLERRVGLTLLRRTAGGSVPTAAGEALAAWARSVLEAAARFDAVAGAVRAETGGRLRLAASYTIAEYLLPGWLSALAPRLSATAVELNVANSTVVTARVLSGAADLGFVEGITVDHGLDQRTIGHDSLIVVVHPRHPWAQRKTPLRPADLAAARLVMREPGSGTREVFEKAIEPLRPGPAPAPLVELGSSTAVKAAVLDGLGPAVISVLVVRNELETGQLRHVPVPRFTIDRKLRAIWTAGVRPPEVANMFVQHAARSSVTPP